MLVLHRWGAMMSQKRNESNPLAAKNKASPMQSERFPVITGGMAFARFDTRGGYENISLERLKDCEP